MPPFEPVIHDRENSEDPEHYQGPIERCNIYWASIRPKTPEKRMRRIGQTGDIDGHTPSTQAPPGARKQLRMADPTQEYAADRGHVGEHKGNKVEGDDSVEGDVGADVDERKQAGADAGEDNGADGELPFGVHVGKKLAERQAVVAGKRPCLTRRGDVERDGTGKDHDQSDDGKNIRAGKGGGIVKDPEDWIARRVSQGGVQVRDAEQVGDEHDNAESAIENIAPEHGPWYRNPSVFNLFGDMSRRVGACGHC